ncbi:3'-5' exonuclease domain-containing protein 2 [Alloprevotella sp. OH1205_COT-284]|uniref:3'-5' exonuclease n=1 Tax=Alloprevotella sp. OH1205_COT-284 TaxID=2491043 RepID=UPI000F5FB0D3|nr:3'-5' exonuclease [Alloprevotella sp. OH1205_COT-284]RRD80650.1 3'-5' exonuclease domain-containing protein 2 [Alloprevotella sp. OH1205_COT-284]
MQQLFIKTDKKIIPTLPRYTFGGRIIVLQSESEAQSAVRFLSKSAILGVDTETRPSFRRGSHHKIALLQIASANICFLFRLNFMGIPECVVKLLENPSILKIGLSLKDDIAQLQQRCPSFAPAGFVDLQQLATQMGIQDLSLAKLFANFFRLRISKSAQLSNWEADVLDEKQKIYAATDAEACIKLYHTMTQLMQSGEYQLLDTAGEQVKPLSPPSANRKKPESSVKATKKSVKRTPSQGTKRLSSHNKNT